MVITRTLLCHINDEGNEETAVIGWFDFTAGNSLADMSLCITESCETTNQAHTTPLQRLSEKMTRYHPPIQHQTTKTHCICFEP